MRSEAETRARDVLRRHSGFARTHDFEKVGIKRWVLSDLVHAGTLERVKRGLYRLPAKPATNYASLLEACMAVPRGIVCLLSALAYYDLATHNPWRISLAVENKAKVVIPPALPIELHFLTKRYYEMGVTTVETPAGKIRIYDREKTVCDCLRFRNRIGLDVALEGLRNYLRARDRDIEKLLRYAAACGVESLVRRYLEAMLSCE